MMKPYNEYECDQCNWRGYEPCPQHHPNTVSSVQSTSLLDLPCDNVVGERIVRCTGYHQWQDDYYDRLRDRMLLDGVSHPQGAMRGMIHGQKTTANHEPSTQLAFDKEK